MKWWGWGEPDISFTHEDKPSLAPFLKEHLDLDVTGAGAPAIDFERLDVPEPNLPDALREALPEVSTDPLDRVVHGRGKSLRDLVRQRGGELGRLPDAVVRPASEDEVSTIVRAALEHDAVVIPFGGGTSISGSLEAPGDETRPVISVDLHRLDRVLDIDAMSRLARVQAGVLGPELERQLNERGWTLGHFPDSFTHSTLGGWIATRSSGMQSDRYGDIAELTRAVRVVTPSGTLVTRPVPATSTGPSVREMVLGSEGRLGVITEATVHVRRLPAERTILGYLFPDWDQGLAAMRDIAASEAAPSVTRVSDSWETAFSFATRKAPDAAGPRQVGRAADLPEEAQGVRHLGDVPVVHRLRGDREARRRAAQARRQDRLQPRRPVHRREPRRAVRPEEVRHALHPRLPAGPRHARRRLRDGRAVERAAAPSTTR